MMHHFYGVAMPAHMPHYHSEPLLMDSATALRNAHYLFRAEADLLPPQAGAVGCFLLQQAILAICQSAAGGTLAAYGGFAPLLHAASPALPGLPALLANASLQDKRLHALMNLSAAQLLCQAGPVLNSEDQHALMVRTARLLELAGWRVEEEPV